MINFISLTAKCYAKDIPMDELVWSTVGVGDLGHVYSLLLGIRQYLHAHPFNVPLSVVVVVVVWDYLGEPVTRKVKPIWIILKQETMSGSGISRAICKSAPRSREVTMPAPHHSVFYRPDALPAAQPTASMH